MPETRGVSASQSGTGIWVMHCVFTLLRIFWYIRSSDFFMPTKNSEKQEKHGEMVYFVMQFLWFHDLDTKK